MNTTQRCEHRYFFGIDRTDKVKNQLDTIPELTKIDHQDSVTETIYLTQGKSFGYQPPVGFQIRIRRYVSDLSKSMKITEENVFFEIKSVGTDNSINNKERILISGRTGTDSFMQLPGSKLEIVPESIKAFLPLIPTGGTQTRRSHWVHVDGMRITLDEDVRFFLFGKNPYEGDLVGTLGEGKIEFKFPKSSNENTTIFETFVVNKCGCVEREPNYLERRARLCLTKNTPVTKQS